MNTFKNQEKTQASPNVFAVFLALCTPFLGCRNSYGLILHQVLEARFVDGHCLPDDVLPNWYYHDHWGTRALLRWN